MYRIYIAQTNKRLCLLCKYYMIIDKRGVVVNVIFYNYSFLSNTNKLEILRVKFNSFKSYSLSKIVISKTFYFMLNILFEINLLPGLD